MKVIKNIRICLLAAMLMIVGVANATHYRSKCVAYAKPASAAGRVWVGVENGTDSQGSFNPDSEGYDGMAYDRTDKGSSATYRYNFYVKEADLNANGYHFVGWFNQADTTKSGSLKTRNRSFSEDVTSGKKQDESTVNKTYYAYWKANTYTVNFDKNANDATLGTTSKIVTYDAQYGAGTGGWPTPTRTNYTFVGWYTDKTAGNKIENTTTVKITGNQTLYAHWTATYYGRAESNANPSAGGGTYISCNGNTPKKDSDYKTFDYSNRSYSNQASQPSCPAYYEAKQYDGYKFNGWYTGKNGTGTLKSSNLSYTEYFTLTAVTEATRTTIVRYAYFVPVTVNSVNPSSTSVTFTKLETKSVTLTFNVSNADATADFNTPSISNTTDWSLTSWSYANNQVTVVVSMTVTGNVTSSGAHNTTVTLTSKGTSDNQSKSATINATVNMNPVFTCAISDHYMVDAAALNLNTLWTSTSNGTKSYKIVSFTPSSANNSGLVSAPTITNGQLSLGQAGTVELKLEQVATTGYNSGEATKTITIHKYNSTFSQVSNLATTVGGTATSNYTLTYVKPNAAYVETTAPAAAGTPGLGSTSGNFYYTLGHKVTTDKQTGCPNEYKTVAITYAADSRTATGRNQGVDTVHLYQKETYKYTSANTSFTVAVSKLPNTIYVKGNENYSSSIYVDSYDNELTLTADNTDYTNCPITNKQTAGTDIATFYQNDKVVYSSYKLGTATWTLSQPENYKYQAGSGSFTVNVIQQPEATNCYIVTNESDQIEKTVGNWLEDTPGKTINLDSRGSSLTFQARKSRNDAISQLFAQATKNGNDWYDLNTEALDLGTSNNTYGPYDVKDVKSIRFCVKSGGSYTKYIDNICVTRKTYLNVGADNSSINGTLTINKKDGGSAIYPGEKGQQSTTVYWGIANGGNLKIKCDDPRFTFSQNTITGVDCNSGTTDIYAYYTDTVAGIVTATATVYNDVYNRTFTVKGVIEKADQLIAWHNDILRLGQSYTDVATANTLVTYESSDESIIRVDEDGEGHKTILTAVGTGTVNITAMAEESSFYAEKSDTKSIKVTEKQIQWIDWNQSLFGLKLGGANVTMNAVAASDVEGCVSSRLIEYSSSNESVVKVVNNNQLQIIGVGTAIITAIQAGGLDSDGHEYERAETEKTVIVRDPNAPCESYAYQQGQEVKMDCGWNALDKQTRTSEINFNGIIPATGMLRYKGEYRKVAINYFDGTMTVEQYIPGENWQPVTGGDLGKPSIGTYKTANLTFDRRATKMRVKVTDGLGYHYFTDCQVTQARFIETTAPVDFNLNVGQQQNQVIYLSYSNIADGLSLTLAQGANSHFSVDKSFIEGSCGSAAKNVALTITYHPTAEETNAQDVLTITDGTTSCQVVLTGSATRVNRHIIWDHADETDIYTVQTETLSAEARTDLNELAGVVTFSLASSSTATGAISMENVLSFTSAGVANVVAYTTDDARYNAAPNVTKVFNVSKTPTTISTLPVLAAVTSGTAVGDVELTGWQVTNTVNNAAVVGVLTISDGDLTNVGENTITLHFEPNNTAMYEACDRTMNVTVVQRPITNEEIGTVSAGSIIYGQKLSDAVLSKTGSLEGELTWIDEHKDEVKEVGTYNDLRVRFTPNNGNVAFKDVLVSVEVTQATPAVTASPVVLTYGAAASSVTPSTETGSLNGAWSWADANMDVVLAVGNHTLDVRFTPTDTKNYSVLNTTIAVTVNKATPVMTPKAVVVTYGTAPSTVTLSTNSGLLAGTWSWNDANSNSTTLAVDNYELNVIFTPDDQGNYNVLNTKVVVTVNKADADATVTAAAITYGQKVSESELTKSGTTAGSWDWDDADKDSQLNAGNHELTIHFTPSNTDNYNAKDAIIILQVNKATPELSWTAAPNEVGFGATDIVYTANSASTGAITYTIIAGSEYASIDANTGALTIKKVGSFTVQASQEATTNYNVPENITQVVTINAPDVNEFIGNGDWNNPANWTGGIVPVDVAPDVVVSGELVINGKVTVGDLTIQPAGGVTIVDDGKLTVTGHSNDIPEYGDIHVKKDGELTLTNSANLKVNDFILDAKLGDGTKAREGASGQVENPGKMEIKGDAYFELALDPSGECSQGWYEFTVPFPVDALTGISRYHGDNLISITYNRNYALMVYDEAARAAGGKGWNYFKGTLQPGICYTITIDDVDNVYRFKKTNDGAFNTAMTQSLHYTDGAGNTNQRGWNGIGNGTLQHINLGAVKDVAYVQIYDHNHNRYIPSALSEFTYVVGSAFFVQSPAAKPDMTYVAASTEESNILRAPKRYEETKDLCLTLTKDGDEYIADRMYVGASEDALNSYEIGHDLAKIGNPTEAKVAQIWANEYGLKLCDVEMPLVSNSANCEINLFAPAAGNYELNVEEAPENTMLYLTYNGRAIWNLTYSPYVFDLTKGTTEGYGLKMYVMQVTTDLEESGFSDQNSVRKVLIDDVIYIVTPEGKMYDITGKSANY